MSHESQQPNTNTKETQDSQTAKPTVPSVQARNRQRSVILYISVLFVAAFLLLGMSLIQERRQQSEHLEDLNQSITGLKDSVSAMQSVQQLYEANAALKDELNDLQRQLDALSALSDEQEQTISALSLDLERTEEALDYFWQINEAFVKNRYSTARQLIEVMERNTDGYILKDFLPTESTTDNGRFSPAGRYQEIYDTIY